MVLGLLDSFLSLLANPWERFRANTLAHYYKKEGFTDKEAEGLAWIVSHRSVGAGVGFLFGIGLVYFQNDRVKRLTYR